MSDIKFLWYISEVLMLMLVVWYTSEERKFIRKLKSYISLCFSGVQKSEYHCYILQRNLPIVMFDISYALTDLVFAVIIYIFWDFSINWSRKQSAPIILFNLVAFLLKWLFHLLSDCYDVIRKTCKLMSSYLFEKYLEKALSLSRKLDAANW